MSLLPVSGAWYALADLNLSPAPTASRAAKLFRHEKPKWVNVTYLNSEQDKYWSPCLQTLEGHEGIIDSMAFSRDGRWLASGSEEWTVKLWDGNIGVLVRTLEGHTRSVQSVAFSQAGRLASGSMDKTVRVWNVETGACLWTFEHSSTVATVMFSQDGRLVSRTLGNSISTWNMEEGTLIWENSRQISDQSTQCSVNFWTIAIGFSRSGGQVVSVSNDGTICLWDKETGELERTMAITNPYASSVSSMVLSADGKLAWRGYGDIIAVFDLDRDIPDRVMTMNVGPTSRLLGFSQDWRRLVTQQRDDIVIWDAQEGFGRFGGGDIVLSTASRERYVYCQLW
jgi:WD40 repeat protein